MYKYLQEHHELTVKMEVVLRGPTATKATGASRRDGGLESECGHLGGRGRAILGCPPHYKRNTHITNSVILREPKANKSTGASRTGGMCKCFKLNSPIFDSIQGIFNYLSFFIILRL